MSYIMILLLNVHLDQIQSSDLILIVRNTLNKSLENTLYTKTLNFN